VGRLFRGAGGFPLFSLFSSRPPLLSVKGRVEPLLVVIEDDPSGGLLRRWVFFFFLSIFALEDFF